MSNRQVHSIEIAGVKRDLPLFEINKVTDTYLILERVNFKHAGWFHFEVFENGKLIEKNKFQVAKEGKY